MAILKYEKVGEVMKLKSKRLSFRQIAKLMNSDVKTVYRWYKRGVGLSTVIHK